MGFYPVEVLINDAKRHGVAVLPVDVNRSRYPDDDRVGRACPASRSPRAPASTGGREVVRSPACVVPDTPDRGRLRGARAPMATASGSGLHLVKGIGEERGRGARRGARHARAVPLARRPRGADRAVRGGHRAAHPRRRARLAGPAATRAAVAAARGRRRDAGGRRPIGSRQGRRADRSTCGCRPTEAPDLPPPTRARAARRRLRDPVARRAAPGHRALPAGARPAGGA